MFVKAFIVNVNKCSKPFFSRTTYQFCKYSHASKRLVYLYLFVNLLLVLVVVPYYMTFWLL